MGAEHQSPGTPVLAVSRRAGEMLVVVPSAYRLWANHPAGVPIPATLSACSLVLALEGAPRLNLSAFQRDRLLGVLGESPAPVVLVDHNGRFRVQAQITIGEATD